MGDTLQRGRGDTVGVGVVKREIVRFLLLSENGISSESSIRSHLFDCFQVSDRTTIRNQHLGYLKTKGIIDVKRESGKDNYWFVVNSPKTAEYVFANFEEDELVEIYRSAFFQEHIEEWYDGMHQVDAPTSDMSDSYRYLEEIQSWEQEYLIEYVNKIQSRVLKVSPSLFMGTDASFPESEIILSFLMYIRKDGPSFTFAMAWDPCTLQLLIFITDLLIDLYRYPPFRRDILDVMTRPDFLQLMVSVLPKDTIDMIKGCLAFWALGKGWISKDEGKYYFYVPLPEPLRIPPAPPDWKPKYKRKLRG
jgi:hypothetical protein